MTTAYDEVPYTTLATPQTHPERMAAVARLFGVRTPGPRTCRVLELGCGDGSNLIPIALSLPESECVGIDLAGRAIAKGRALSNEAGAGNVALHQMNVTDIGEEPGRFDYIVAHGFYSWVSSDVGEKLLEVIGTNLATNGVAFVSYNTLPGGHVRQMLREMLLYHVRGLEEPAERIECAIELTRKLSTTAEGGDEYRALLKKECERALDNTRGHFYHDDLAEVNEPVYFSQFMERAAKHGLQYVAEADLHQMQGTAMLEGQDESPSGVERIRREQYEDFERCRRFRQTLLCRQDLTVRCSPGPDLPDALWLYGDVTPISKSPSLRQTDTEEFRVVCAGEERPVTTDHPIIKAALIEIGNAWPAGIQFSWLLAQCRALLRGASENWSGGRITLGKAVLKLCGAGIVEPTMQAPEFAVTAGEFPQASTLARIQARDGERVVNYRHRVMKIESRPIRELLTLLDGTRDRETLRGALSSEVSAGQLGTWLTDLARSALLSR